MRSVYEDYAVPMRPVTLGNWLEAVMLTLVAMLLGYLYSPQDPLLVTADFPWMIFAPLLVAVRYGFLPGLLSAGLLLLGLLVSSTAQQSSLPISYIIGMLLSTFLAGEFRDIWFKKLTKLYMANEYRQYRLDDFTRSYRLLQVSHDELELRIAGNNRSMRNTLLLLRQALQSENITQQNELAAIAEHAMQVFIRYGSFTAAGLYKVVGQEQKLELKPLVSIGDMPELSVDDILLQACLKNKHTVSIRDEVLDQGANPSQLKVCVPLLDTEQTLVGVLAIAEIPFFSMTEQTLNLLTLLAGYIADVLHGERKALRLTDPHAQYFSQQLQRAFLNSKKHKLSSALCVFELNTKNEALQQLLEQSQRGLDLQIELTNNRNHDLLMVLLPLTAEQGLQSYLKRINALVAHQNPDMDLAKLNVTVLTLQLDRANAADLNKFIYKECGLNEQQLAV